MDLPTFVACSWRQTLTIATAFWGACLALVAIEATLGTNAVVAGLFFLSIPLLVACLTWANLGIVFHRPRRDLAAVFVLGMAVLLSASLIILVGLLAAANLKTLIISV